MTPTAKRARGVKLILSCCHRRSRPRGRINYSSGDSPVEFKRYYPALARLELRGGSPSTPTDRISMTERMKYQNIEQPSKRSELQHRCSEYASIEVLNHESFFGFTTSRLMR
ncbi:hypothetical protein DdX_00877 [Ditylenchus destructor]|uniref:Uncharacterized protein n=1 Tax=Ditylenchus destructor TaxID=166010 RepID=A0AAD4NLE0_9BILA|nr:hypothetical protein DdX_00877 [Ditylenchus destructor]